MRSYHKQESSEARSLVEPTWGAARWGAKGDGVGLGGVLSSALLSDLDLWDGQSQALSLSPTTIVPVVRLKSHRFLSRGSENLTQTHYLLSLSFSISEKGIKMLYRVDSRWRCIGRKYRKEWRQ